MIQHIIIPLSNKISLQINDHFVTAMKIYQNLTNTVLLHICSCDLNPKGIIPAQYQLIIIIIRFHI